MRRFENIGIEKFAKENGNEKYERKGKCLVFELLKAKQDSPSDVNSRILIKFVLPVDYVKENVNEMAEENRKEQWLLSDF